MKTSFNSLSTCSDEELMCFVQQGNVYAFRILILRYKTAITRFAYHYCGSYATAIDIARDTFVSLFKADTQYTAPNELSSWIFSAALQLSLSIDSCATAQRTRSTHSGRMNQSSSAVEQFLPPDIPLRNHLVGGHIQTVLCSVEDIPRAILILRDIFLFPYIKIAAIADCDPKTAKILCEQGRREFRNKLRQLHERYCMPN